MLSVVIGVVVFIFLLLEFGVDNPCSEVISVLLYIVVGTFAGVISLSIGTDIMNSSTHYESTNNYSYTEYTEEIATQHKQLPSIQGIKDVQYDVSDGNQEYVEVRKVERNPLYIGEDVYKCTLHKVKGSSAYDADNVSIKTKNVNINCESDSTEVLDATETEVLNKMDKDKNYVYCPECGAKQKITNKYCTECGSKIK